KNLCEGRGSAKSNELDQSAIGWQKLKPARQVRLAGLLNEEGAEQFSQRLCAPVRRQGCGDEPCSRVPIPGSTRSRNSQCLLRACFGCRDRNRDRAVHRRVTFVECRFGLISQWGNGRHGNHGGERKNKRTHVSLKKHKTPTGVNILNRDFTCQRNPDLVELP